MKLNLFLLLLIVFTIPASAQEFELGKVSQQELEEKVNPSDTSASAAILFKKGRTWFSIINSRFIMNTEVQCRIKIYKKEGYRYATQSVPLYTGGRTERMFFNDAYTYNLVNGKIEKTKLKADGEFEEQVNENYKVKKITMPNVKEGSVIEYSYKIETPYFMQFEDWYFQYDIPVNNIEYEVAIPEYFVYNRFMTGYLPINETKPKNRVNSGRFNETVVTYTATNVKALKDENYVHNIDNYQSKVKHELASVQYPNQAIERFSTDWTSVAKSIYDEDRFGKELKQTGYFEEDLKQILNQQLTPVQKVDAIFSYVRTRMNWNERFGIMCNNGVKKAYQNKVGNAAEINLMLTAMLRYAKLEANPVLISTRSNGIALFPTRAAYNYVIAGVKIDGNIVLLDATSKNTMPNILPMRVLNWQGRMIMSTGATAEIDLTPKFSKEVLYVTADIAGDGTIKGKVRDQYFDYNAYLFRERHGNKSKDAMIENLETQYEGVVIEDHEVSNTIDFTKPVVEGYDFSHNGIADVIGNKIYISPMLHFTRTTNPFKTETREYPIEFNYPFQDTYNITLKIPEGYTVESLPKPVNMLMEQNIGSFKYNIQSVNKSVQVSVAYSINHNAISQEYYLTIRDFFQKMVEKQNEKIILVKK